MKANELVALKSTWSRKVQNLEKEMVKNHVKIDNADNIWLRSKVKRIVSQLLTTDMKTVYLPVWQQV